MFLIFMKECWSLIGGQRSGRDSGHLTSVWERFIPRNVFSKKCMSLTAYLFHLSEYLISNHSLRNATHKQSAIVHTGHNSNILPSADLGRIIS